MAAVWQALLCSHACFPAGCARKNRRRRLPTMSPGHGFPFCGPDLMALKTTTTTPDRLASVAEIIGIDSHELQDAFVCEDWNAELSTGLLRLGPETAFLHGAAGAPCGIMDLIRFYDPADLSRVLQTLEEAAAVSTEFTFATTIRQAPGRSCLGSGRNCLAA